MPRKPLLFVLLLAVIGAVPAHLAAADAGPPPVVVKTMTVDVVVQPDGSYTTTLHVERLATNQSAAQKIAQQTVEYSESMETAEVLEAFTRKTDGKVLEVDRTQIFPQAPPGSPRVPMFNDRKQKVIVFPDVTAQDMVVFTISRTHKPPFAGQFFGGDVFQRRLAFEEARENITLPKAMAAHVEAQGVEHELEESTESITHKFLYRNPPADSSRTRGPVALGHRSALHRLDLPRLRRSRDRLSSDRRRKGGRDAAHSGIGRRNHGGHFRSAGAGAEDL